MNFQCHLQIHVNVISFELLAINIVKFVGNCISSNDGLSFQCTQLVLGSSIGILSSKAFLHNSISSVDELVSILIG